MENMDDVEDYMNYWETTMFFQNEELDSWPMEEAFSGSYDSSSPDGAAASSASRNVVSERNRREKLKHKLYALRSVVPNITKLDRASVIKDSIEYIQELQEQERRLETEVRELEFGRSKKKLGAYVDDEDNYDQELCSILRPKKFKQINYDSIGSTLRSPIDVLDLKVTSMGEKTVAVSITCSKKTDTMVRLCQIFDSLKLSVLTANLSSFSGRLFSTFLLQADEDEKEILKQRIETAIAAFNDPQSPMSII